MKNLKYIYALSSIFVSFYVFGYNTNFNSEEKVNDIQNNEEINEEKEINKINKKEVIEGFNNYYSSSRSFKLLNGSIISNAYKNPVKLEFKGNYEFNSNSLSSFVISSTLSYNGLSKSYDISYGSTSYDVINYNNQTYLFNNNEEFKGILSFPATLDSQFPVINETSTFSSIFDNILNLDESNIDVNYYDSGYLFLSNNFKIYTDSSFNLSKIESINNDNLIYTFNFENIKSINNEVSKIDNSSKDILTTFKNLLKESSFNIDINAEIKSSKNIKFDGNLIFDYTSSVLKQDPLVLLDLKEYTDNNYSNNIKVNYENGNIYFKLDNLLKGKINDSTISDIISVSSGLLNDSSLDYELNKSLNEMMNTETFESIFNLDLSSLDSSLISNLSINHNLISFKLDSKAFNLNNGYITFEIGLNNAKIKTLKIKDFKYSDSSTLNVSLNFKETNKLEELNDKDTYPSYDSILPYYKNILKIVNNSSFGGSFATSLFDKSTSSSLGLSTNFNVNYKDILSSSDVNNLYASLDNLNINYLDESDNNKVSNALTAMFLEDTSSSSKNSFNVSIDDIYYKNKGYYIALSDSSSTYKYTLNNSSLGNLIDSINKLNEGKESISTLPSTNKGFNHISDQIKRLDYLMYVLNNNETFNKIIQNIKNNYSLFDLEKYVSISPIDNNYKIEFNLYSLFDYDSNIIKEFSLNNSCSIVISSSGDILSVNSNDLSVDDITSSISLSLKDYDNSKELNDTKIKEEWNNSKDLNDVIDRVSNVMDAFSKYNLKNASIANLFNVDFVYKDLSINGNLSSILHFNSQKSLDEKYLEAYIPIKLNDKKGVNDVSAINLSLVYSDKDKEESNFKNIVYNYSRLYKGTQASISLNYGSNISSRNYSTLNAYSSKEALGHVAEALSKIESTNILYSYKIVRDIQKYASQISDLLNNKDTNTLTSLAKSGLISNETLIKILNSLSSTSTTLDINLDLSKFSDSEELSKFNIKVSLVLDITKDELGNNVYSINSIKAIDKENEINLNLSIEETVINKDSSLSINTKRLSKDIINGFISVGSENHNKYSNFVDMEYLACLIELGVTTTNKRYYSISGTFNIDDSININIDTLGIDCDLSDIKPINSVTFNLKLEFYKQDKEDYTYKLKSYLGLQNDKHPTYTTEFYVEEAEDGNDNIYINEFNGSSNSMSFMKKETMLGNMKVSVTELQEDETEKETKSGDVPRILYYVLDASGILNDEIIDINYSVLDLNLALKEVILSTIFDMMVKETDEDGNVIEDESSKNNIQIDYLSGWSMYFEKDAKTGSISGYVEADLSKIILGIELGEFATFNFGSKIKLTLNQIGDDVISFNLNQSNTEGNLINIKLNYGDVKMNLTVQLKESTFLIISSNSTYQINTGMERYNDFVKYFKNLDIYKKNQETYVTKVICPEIVIAYTMPTTVDIYSKYRPNFNSLFYKHYTFSIESN